MAKNTLLHFLALTPSSEGLPSPKFDLNPASGMGRFSSFTYPLISKEIQHTLEKKLNQDSRWLQSRPILLGSWARGELCPHSDLDVLFLGPEALVGSLVGELQVQGIKMRSRVPLDPEDLLQGVEAFDVLNLLQARAVNPQDQPYLEKTQQKIFHSKVIRQKILRAIVQDRKKRAAHFDSLSNLLEPQLKNSPGGLRDIDQALQLLSLFRDRFSEGEVTYPLQVLTYAKELFLQLRVELHLMNLQDHLISTAQLDLSHKYQFHKTQDFMKEISRSFSRAHFYSDWVFEVIRQSEKAVCDVQRKKFEKPAQGLSLLFKNPNVLMQKKIRTEMDFVFKKRLNDKERGRLLFKAISSRTPEAVTQAVFRSRLVDHLCPAIRPLIGYVQHDQYHRWTADRHLLQACLELKRVARNPKLLFALKEWQVPLKKEDWQILSWTCLYHDLTKGQKGDHSSSGEELVKSDFKKFGIPARITKEVCFLVKNHLELSLAAFRKNPQDEATWKNFWELGMTSSRLRRLAIFTAVDIRATHPDAWNTWKADLLAGCVRNLLAPEKEDFFKLKQKWGKALGQDLVDSLDPQVLLNFTPQTLATDLVGLKKTKPWQNIKNFKDIKGRHWLRFYRAQDELGLFQFFVRTLFQVGINIEQALVQTLPSLGVYDLFQISKRHFHKAQRLELILETKISPPPLPSLSLQLQKIELISETAEEVVLSFQGPDASGLLLAIAQDLKELGLFVTKARVHTWGGQIEDLIHVKPIANLPEKIEILREKLIRGRRPSKE